jgi:hypothetical protein
MKSVFAIGSLLFSISIACTYKSAGSQPLPNNNRAAPPIAETNAPAQEKPSCSLTLAGAPTINGLRLGMTSDEVLALFPGSKNDPPVRADLERPPSRYGTSSFNLSPDKYESKDRFTGISQVTIRLLDGRVSEFRMSYNGPAYAQVDNFITKFAAASNLPKADQWEAYVGMENQMKTLKCTEFEVQAFVGGQGGNLNYVDVKDLIADKKLKDRRDKARAQATPTP